MIRRGAALLALAVSLAGPAASQARDPVLFVHGWQGDRAQWGMMHRRLRAEGWTDRQLFAWTFRTGESNDVAARRVAAHVDQILVATGAMRVDIVSHSMGGLAVQRYLQSLESVGKVDAWVSLGGPHHGTLAAHLCFSVSCREMRPGSEFLTALAGNDETPGNRRFATWWSPCDEIIEPVESARLQGAENNRTGCISHLGLLRDESVYRGVRDFIVRPHAATHPPE